MPTQQRNLESIEGPQLAPAMQLAVAIVVLAVVFGQVGTAWAQPAIGQSWSKQTNDLASEFSPFVESTACDPCALTWDFGVNGRAFYHHDARIEFTGQESTFAVEGALRGQAVHCANGISSYFYGEVFLNQPYDRNLLTDYALRESFAHNFDVDTFELSQLSIGGRRGDLSIEIGKFATPFGRYYSPVFLNQFVDMPFLRSEAIIPRETGVLARYQPSHWRMAVAYANGSLGRDTNSSKALIARIGCETDRYALGASVKMQDGIGSEGNKEFKNHAGVDGFFRFNECWSIAGEFVYDQYGMRKPGVPLDSITWGRSLYNRQIHQGVDEHLEGYGYYCNVMYSAGCFDGFLGYGEFYPEIVGDPIHDEVTRRFMINGVYHFSPYADAYTTLMLENQVANAQGGRTRHGFVLVTGLQFRY